MAQDESNIKRLAPSDTEENRIRFKISPLSTLFLRLKGIVQIERFKQWLPFQTVLESTLTI
jgi:hypothetical protein